VAAAGWSMRMKGPMSGKGIRAGGAAASQNFCCAACTASGVGVAAGAETVAVAAGWVGWGVGGTAVAAGWVGWRVGGTRVAATAAWLPARGASEPIDASTARGVSVASGAGCDGAIGATGRTVGGATARGAAPVWQAASTPTHTTLAARRRCRRTALHERTGGRCLTARRTRTVRIVPQPCRPRPPNAPLVATQTDKLKARGSHGLGALDKVHLCLGWGCFFGWQRDHRCVDREAAQSAWHFRLRPEAGPVHQRRSRNDVAVSTRRSLRY
jgi:hypothetical protein